MGNSESVKQLEKQRAEKAKQIAKQIAKRLKKKKAENEKVSQWIANINQRIANLDKEDAGVRRRAVDQLLVRPDLIQAAAGIGELVALLKSEKETTRESAVMVLQGLTNTSDQDAVREAGGIELLVVLLADEDICGNAVHVLKNLAHKNPPNQDAIREVGGIAPLVALLKKSVGDLRRVGVAALRELASNERNKDAIREAAGIAPLVALLEDPDQDVRLDAAGVLGALAFNNSSNKDAICKVGGVVALILLLKDRAAPVRQYAAAALASLAHDILNVAAIKKAGGHYLLMLLLEDKVAEVRTNAAAALELLGHRAVDIRDSAHDANSKSDAMLVEKVVHIIRFEDLRYADSDYLGKGAFSKVYKGVWKGVDVAVKEFLFQELSEEATEELWKEAIVMQRLRHPNIMPLYGACVEPRHRSLVMPYLGGGSLRQVLADYSEKLSWPLRWKIALGISRGVSYLHGYKPPILHRDLKSSNVMLDERNVPMVADFGLSKAKTETSTATGVEFPPRGSAPWMATELFDGARHSEASDIFALGVVFWELATRKVPWSGVGVLAIAERLAKRERNKIPEKTPRSYARLIERCWAQRKERRPRIDEVVKELETHQSESARAASAT